MEHGVHSAFLVNDILPAWATAFHRRRPKQRLHQSRVCARLLAQLLGDLPRKANLCNHALKSFARAFSCFPVRHRNLLVPIPTGGGVPRCSPSPEEESVAFAVENFAVTGNPVRRNPFGFRYLEQFCCPKCPVNPPWPRHKFFHRSYPFLRAELVPLFVSTPNPSTFLRHLSPLSKFNTT